MNKWLTMSVLVFFLSCKKEEGNKMEPLAQRVKTVTNGNTLHYTYDEQKRLVKAEADLGFYKEEYVYEPGRVSWSLSEASITIHSVYELDVNGYLKSSRYVSSPDISFYEFTPVGVRVRTYDDKNPITETRYYYNAGTGLLDSTRMTTGGVWKSTNLFSFFTDKANTIADINFGRGFWGHLSPHPAKAIVTRRPDGNTINVSFTNYTYTYDDRGRIASRTFTTSGGQTGTETYTYY